MANEIKFVFSGDTADFDKAIDSIIKKTNRIKDSNKEANKLKKQAVNLEKLLADEYEKARRSAGSLTDITVKLAREEARRLEINKKLSSEALSQSQRQSLILERSKSQARTSGLKGAGVAGMGKLAATAVVAAVAAGAAAATQGTFSAMNEAQATRKEALNAGQTIEQFQTNQFAKSINRSPKEVGEAIKSLGLIIDEDLNRSLSDSGHKLRLLGNLIMNKMIPAFAFLAEKLVDFGIWAASFVETVQKQGPKETGKFAMSGAAGAGLLGLPQAALNWFLKSMGKGPEKNFMEQWGKNREILKEKFGQIFGAPEIPEARQVSPLKVFSDSLSRIGLFKTGAESQIQTMKKSLVQLAAINRNTTGLKEEVRDA
jgi:cell fate (sporulation/competence/biofilm development) regulator YmcA (YheA/YmcA/DUF963 family)